MKPLFTRLATVAMALPLASGMVAGAAQASTTTIPVSGCYGAVDPTWIVCNPVLTVERPDPALSVRYVQGCVGECYNVPVQWAEYSGKAQACLAYTDRNGTPYKECTSDTMPSSALLAALLAQLECQSETQSGCTHS
jgi:hypothetical protein